MTPTGNGAPVSPAATPLDLNATYSVNAKALRRWAAERLSLSGRDDGTWDALFRYDGSTCSNMGRALAFEYRVLLAAREDGYELLDLRCATAPGDEGHAFMCRYRVVGEGLLAEISDETPLLGRPLNDVLAWERALIGPGCYCERASRDHKWGLVLETIHYALAQQERSRAGANTMPQALER